MHFSTALAVAAAVAPIVGAHEGPSVPRIAGINMRDLKARDMFARIQARAVELAEVDHHPAHEKRGAPLDARQNTDGQCGGTFGSCAAGYCCSEAGWCGKDADYCYSPGCQFKYGPGCPENATPAGASTKNVARPKSGNVAYGGNGIYNCVEDGMVAITYDDGPLQNYTAHVLDLFASYNAKATFFITGNNINKGEIDITPELSNVVKRAHTAGHQIASHTWTHLDLSAISTADRENQMVKNEMAIRNILGFFPTYMRPPYSSCTAESGCESQLATLGYHIIYFDVDTDDYQQTTPNLIQNSKNWFKGNITAGGATAKNSNWLSISHDIHEQTAYNLTDFMLSTITSLGYKAVTVGECLGDPVANWYRSSTGSTGTTSTGPTATGTPTSSAPTSSATLKVSTDATCGSAVGFTCSGSTFGNCCSSAGWCGSTTDYCGTGCQSQFGTCGSSSASSVTPVTLATSTRVASSAAATSTQKVTTDATCGGANAFTCQGSTFGNCCSSAGWCGSTSAYCGTGCQPGFGTCTTSGNEVPPVGPVVTPTPSATPGNGGNNGNGLKKCSPGILGWLAKMMGKCR